MSIYPLFCAQLPPKTLDIHFIEKQKMDSNNLILSILLIMSMAVPLLVSSTEFQVGGDMGWTRPPKNNSDMYNQWASRQRFHVGDTISFKYKKDSVLVVDKEDYKNCVDSDPISRFADGSTIYEFEQFGYHYFISGQPGHCKSGQKMVIRVMAKSEVETPKISPAPKSDGGDEEGHHGWDSDDFGPPRFNATTQLSVTSCFITALTAMVIVLYLFM